MPPWGSIARSQSSRAGCVLSGPYGSAPESRWRGSGHRRESPPACRKGRTGCAVRPEFPKKHWPLRDLEGKEGPSPCCVRDTLQDLVSGISAAGDLVQMAYTITSARCAISIASSRETWLWLSSPSLSRMIARRTAPFCFSFPQLVAAGVVKRVVHGGAAARTQAANAFRKLLGVVGEILRDFRRGVEPDDKRPVELRTHDLVQKLDCGFLLELETVADRVAGVDQQSHPQRKVGLAVKAADLSAGRPSSITRKSVFLQVGDVRPFLSVTVKTTLISSTVVEWWSPHRPLRRSLSCGSCRSALRFGRRRFLRLRIDRGRRLRLACLFCCRWGGGQYRAVNPEQPRPSEALRRPPGKA